jgi:hypothetical protein
MAVASPELARLMSAERTRPIASFVVHYNREAKPEPNPAVRLLSGGSGPHKLSQQVVDHKRPLNVRADRMA